MDGEPSALARRGLHLDVAPISWASRRTIERPRPVPPKRRVVELSACINGSNKRARVVHPYRSHCRSPSRRHDRPISLGAANRMDPHEALVSELDGVSDQIEQNLAHPRRVADDPIRPGAGRFGGQL